MGVDHHQQHQHHLTHTMAIKIRADLFQADTTISSTANHSNVMEHISSKLEKNDLIKKKAEKRKRDVDELMKAMERELRSQNKIKMAKEAERKAQEAQINEPEEESGGWFNARKILLEMKSSESESKKIKLAQVTEKTTSTQEAEPEEA